MRWRIPLVLTLALFVAVSCDQQPVEPQVEQAAATDFNFVRGNPVVHHASLGSNDACEVFGLPPGCDANFSLVANQFADGTVNGQWQDQFAGGVGLHVAVDCLIVYDNQAVVGGVITKAPFDPNNVGARALTTVVDNGTSANDDPDQISFSFFPFDTETCDTFGPELYPLFDLTKGQVKVW